MALMGTLLEQACAKLKPALEASHCQLVVLEGRNKSRVLDLDVPYRLTNIPTNAKLAVQKGACLSQEVVGFPK